MVLVPDLLLPDAGYDFPRVVEAVAEQAERADFHVRKGNVGCMHRVAGIRIADALRRECEHEVERHVVAGWGAVDAELDAELRSDFSGDVRRIRHKMPIGCGADRAGRRQLAGMGSGAGRLPGIGPGVGDRDAGYRRAFFGDGRRGLRGGAACRGREEAQYQECHAHQRVFPKAYLPIRKLILLAWNSGSNALNVARALVRKPLSRSVVLFMVEVPNLVFPG